MMVYPRFDTAFKKKGSFNYDMFKSEVYVHRPIPKSVEFWRWFALMLIGIFIGATAFGMSQLEEFLIDTRREMVDKILDDYDNNQYLAWGFLCVFCFSLSAIGSALTVHVGPGANGSGIAEIIAVLNGVNYPLFVGWRTFLVKIFCVVFAIAGSIFVGKEGPLAHIGSIAAFIVIYYIPIDAFKYFQNDIDKREFMCAGISAGVSAAFGAPIGGALFSYELSKPSTFWSFEMIWRTFFCSSVSTYIVSLLNQIKDNGFNDLQISSSGTIKFGKLSDLAVPLKHIHGAFVLGILGGVLGALFINVHTRMGRLRKKFITSNCKKIIETGMFGMVTVSAMTLLVITLNRCEDIPTYDPVDLNKEEYESELQAFNKWTCEEDQYNPLATLFFNTEANTIKSLFHASKYYKVRTWDLTLFACCWYFFTIITYGVWVPAGLFLPGIIMGGAMGRLYTKIIQNTFDYVNLGEIQQNALLGAAAMLSGYCRMTYSLTVIMLETT
jgi:chloride channel 6